MPSQDPDDPTTTHAAAAASAGLLVEEPDLAAIVNNSGESRPAANSPASPAPEPRGEAERPAEGVALQVEGEPAIASEAISSGGDAPPPAKPRRSRKARPASNGSKAGAGGDSTVVEGQVSLYGAPVDYGGLGLESVLESLLFVADGPVPLAHLAEALGVHSRDVEAVLAGLSVTYQQRGLSLQRFRDRVQLTTAPAAAAVVERFLGLAATTPLSRAALETLSIIAYQQPVTRPQIEAVRGVNSDSVIKNLLTKGLVEETGRAEGPGRPVLYSTTSEFLQHFGLASLADLPPLALPGVAVDTPPAASHEDILKG